MNIKLRNNREVTVALMQLWEDIDGLEFVIVASDPLRRDCFVISMLQDDVPHTYADEEFLKTCYLIEEDYSPRRK